MKKIYLKENILDQKGQEYYLSENGMHPVCGCIYNDSFMERRRCKCGACWEKEFWEKYQS